jgi:CHAT domain
MAGHRSRLLNFDLTIDWEGEGACRAQVTTAPRGAGASARFRLPVQAGPGASDSPEAMGARLFDTIFTGEVGNAWRASLGVVEHPGDWIRLRISAPTTAGVSWERLYDRSAGRYLVQTGHVIVARFVDTEPAGPLNVDGPLRVLVVLPPESLAPQSPDGLERDERRWAALDDAVRRSAGPGQVLLDRLTVPTRRALVDWLRYHQVHVLHVVQHGDGADGGSFTGPGLATLVRDHPSLRIVVFDRRGAGTAAGATTESQAAELVRLACPAVVAMPTAMSDPAASLFAVIFYESLARGETVDVAVTWARAALQLRHPAELTTPALFLGRRDALVVHRDGTLSDVGADNMTKSGVTPPPAGYTGGYQQPPPPPSGAAPPPGYGNQTASPPPAGSVHVERPSTSSRWRSVRETVGRWLSGPSSATEPPAGPAPSDPDPVRTAYPRIDVRRGRWGRPDVVVIHEPFEVTVGLAPFQDVDLAQTGGLQIAATRRTEIEVVLTFDPSSLATPGPTRRTLTLTDRNPFPSVTVVFTALYRPDLQSVRRIGVQYLRDGKVVGMAWRRFVVVLLPSAIESADPPPHEPNPLMDLEPLLGEDVPDLVLSVCASDGPATGEFVWTAWAAASDVVVPDAPRISRLDSGLQQFAAGMRDTVAYATDPYAAYLSLVGKATKLGRAIPPGIASVVRRVVEDQTRNEAAAVLLLTEELALPWELAVFNPPLDTVWGGTSPFLGSHAAISRWPLTESRDRPTPGSTVTVRRAAVLTADYGGVQGCSELEHAMAEAAQVATLFAPPAVAVAPSLRDVVGMFRGVPPADVVHVALHGRFDAVGSDEGLVLLATDSTGALSRTPQLLTPDQVETGRLDGGPFVFLNACQVASDKRVLADYAGFASTLLRIGATGVVAPLWNVDDAVAAEFAAAFYAATWTANGRDGTPEPTSVAEAVRALRARYTEAAAETHMPGVTATLIAFQVFGHPRLRLAHV